MMMGEYILILGGSAAAKVPIRDVILIERQSRKLHIVTTRREYRYYERIENIEGVLDERFYPCLKGCYINLERIAFMEETEIHFDNGYVFFLGRTNFIKARQKYKLFLKNSVELVQ